MRDNLRGATPAFIHISDGKVGIFFVTWAKRGMNARRVYSAKTDRTTGVIRDQSIRLNGYYDAIDEPEHLRRTRSSDPEPGKTRVLLTNDTTLPPLTIVALYITGSAATKFRRDRRPQHRLRFTLPNPV